MSRPLTEEEMERRVKSNMGLRKPKRVRSIAYEGELKKEDADYIEMALSPYQKVLSQMTYLLNSRGLEFNISLRGTAPLNSYTLKPRGTQSVAFVPFTTSANGCRNLAQERFFRDRRAPACFCTACDKVVVLNDHNCPVTFAIEACSLCGIKFCAECIKFCVLCTKYFCDLCADWRFLPNGEPPLPPRVSVLARITSRNYCSGCSDSMSLVVNPLTRALLREVKLVSLVGQYAGFPYSYFLRPASSEIEMFLPRILSYMTEPELFKIRVLNRVSRNQYLLMVLKDERSKKRRHFRRMKVCAPRMLWFAKKGYTFINVESFEVQHQDQGWLDLRMLDSRAFPNLRTLKLALRDFRQVDAMQHLTVRRFVASLDDLYLWNDCPHFYLPNVREMHIFSIGELCGLPSMPMLQVIYIACPIGPRIRRCFSREKLPRLKHVVMKICPSEVMVVGGPKVLYEELRQLLARRDVVFDLVESFTVPV